MAKNKSDIEELDDLNRYLIKIAKAGSCEVSESLAIFNGSVKYLAVKNKIDPDGGEGDGWSQFRKGSGSGGKGGHDTQPKKAARASSATARRTASSHPSAQPAGNTEDQSGRHADNDHGVDLVQGAGPASNSFPVPFGGFYTGTHGSDGA